MNILATVASVLVNIYFVEHNYKILSILYFFPGIRFFGATSNQQRLFGMGRSLWMCSVCK